MITISTCQMTSSTDVGKNLKLAETLIKHSAKADCDIVCLPEMFACLPSVSQNLLDVAEDYQNGLIQERMASLAKKCGIWIVAGTIPLKSENPERVYNTCLVYDRNGEEAARYDKIHLFSLITKGEKHDESEIFLPGNKPVQFTFQQDDGEQLKVGLAVCYDLRFPELFRCYDADLLIIPSAFTVKTGKAHWQALLQARAIENQCYVTAPAQAGTNNVGRSCYGNAMTINGWGKILARMGGKDTGFITAALRTGKLEKIREKLPALKNKALFNA